MIKTIYTNTWNIIKKIPVKLWGLTILNSFLIYMVSLLGIVPLLIIPVIFALNAGMNAIYLHAYTHGGEADTKKMFSPFKDWAAFKHIAGGMGWMYLWIILWSLIPIAGFVLGIYKSLSYAFTPYILLEDNSVSGIDALKKSMQETKGVKFNMFIGILLPVIGFTFAIFLLSLPILIPLAAVKVIFLVLVIILYIIFCLVAPIFLGLVSAGFYDYKKTYGIAPHQAPYQQQFRAYDTPAQQQINGYDRPGYMREEPFRVEQSSYDPGPAQYHVSSAPAQKSETDAGTVTCPSCGTTNTADKKFCSMCGHKLA